MANLVLKHVFKDYGSKMLSVRRLEADASGENAGSGVAAPMTTVRRFAQAPKSGELAVNDFSLACTDGEFVGILGPSGCGKTTTLRMVAGLETVTAGEIYIGDRLINNVHPKDRQIGLAFEDYALYPPLSVYDNIAFNLRAAQLPEREIRRRVLEIAPKMKVDSLLAMKPAALSGGQKQRVNIARALVRKPEVLLLDEPLSHLDGKMRQVLRSEIKRIHNDIRCTAIIVTHDQLEAMSLADRVAVMKDGRLQQFGTPQEVYDDPANAFVAGFIGEPPMNLMRVGVSASAEGRFFVFPKHGIKVVIPEKYRNVLADGDDVLLGVRPTDVLVDGGDGSGSPAAVAVLENFGDEVRLSIDVGEEDYLVLTVDPDCPIASGDRIRLKFRASKTHVFNPQTLAKIPATDAVSKS